jgi:hypothetical protein
LEEAHQAVHLAAAHQVGRQGAVLLAAAVAGVHPVKQ